MENKKIWFKAKRYGWGWTPASIEGWICIAIFMALVIITAFLVEKFTNSEMEFAIIYMLLLLLQTIPLIYICYKKGEKPGWRWG